VVEGEGLEFYARAPLGVTPGASLRIRPTRSAIYPRTA